MFGRIQKFHIRPLQVNCRRSFISNRVQLQSLPPISDDQSLRHIPKIKSSDPKGTKRSFFKKAIYTTKILTAGVVGAFILGTIYVVVSEYMEDKASHNDSAEDPLSLRFTSQQNEDGDYPTIIWPSQIENVDKSKIKPKLVVLGSGWGAIGLLKNLEKEKYDVLVVSPSNYFLFTPLLPSVTVGTLEPRSLLEPIRRILRRFGPGGANFFQASAVDVDIQDKKVLLEGKDGTRFYVPYDQLVVAVGSKTNSMGVKGLEHSNFLHSIQDARKIRAKIFDLLESASLPTVSPERRREMLSFVVCGGGVEFAAELEDFINTDISSYSQEHILNTYDKKISLYTESRFKDHKMNLIINSRVEEVKQDEIIYSTKGSDGKITKARMPYGLVLWSTGIAMQPLVSEISKKLKEQTRSRALTVDSQLKVLGVPDGNIFAVGDCASVETPKLIPKLMELFANSDVNGDASLDFQEFTALADRIAKARPQASVHLKKLADVFDKYDVDHSGTLDLKELECLLNEIDNETTSLPATAQVANQQGKYLATYFSSLSKGYQLSLSKEKEAPLEKHLENASVYASSQLAGFQYRHLGSLAYIGNSAVAELESPVAMFPTPKVVLAGFSAMYLWRSIYWSEQVSLRTRLLLSLDWTKRVVFGRDISKF